MKVAILGTGLTGITLAKLLLNQGVKVDFFFSQKIRKINRIQTIGISKSNIDFFNKNILDIKKFLWNINKIEIYNENLDNNKIIDFKNKSKYLFSTIRNCDLYNCLISSLTKNKLITFKKKINYKNLLDKNYGLIFNCDHQNPISKKFFSKKIEKDYNSFAHVTTFNHKRLLNNNVASQIFTKKGPFAFLPISKKETSIVYSARGEKDIDIENLIKKYNTKYEILKIKKSMSFKLKSSNLRSYYHKNVIAFGDLLHKLHPLAGQGFNMTIRDIKEILKLVKFKKDHGLELDTSICLDFEKNTKNRNYLFSNGIDLIYEFFNYENKINNNTFNKYVKLIGQNQILNKIFTKFADDGLVL